MAQFGGSVRPASELRRRARAVRFAGVAATAALALAGSLSLGATSAFASTTSTLSIIAGTGTSGAPTAGSATASTLGQPDAVAVDPSGDVFIADGSASVVEEVTPDGQLSIIAGTGAYGAPTPGPATSSELGTPDGVAVDSSGNLYIADAGNNEIDEVSSSGTLSIVAGTGSFGAPTPGPATSSELADPQQIAVDGVGDVYVADAHNDVVEEITPGGTLSIVAGDGKDGVPTPGPATSSSLGEPYGVAVDSSGNLYIADPYNNVVEEVSPGGTLSIVAGDGIYGAATAGPATESDLSQPTGVAVDSNGNLYIADNFGQYVEEVTPDGQLSILAGTGAAGTPKPGPATSSPLDFPNGVATDNSGDVFVADSGNFVVEEIETPAPSAPSAPVNVSATPTANGATVSWSAPSGGSQPITSYVVTPYLNGTAQVQNVVPGTATSTDVTGLTAGATYTFTVVAVNNAGSSPPAATASVVPVPTSTTTTVPTRTTGTSPSSTGVPRRVGAIARLSSLHFRRDAITLATRCERSCSGEITIMVSRSSSRGWRHLVLARGAFHLVKGAAKTVRLRITPAGARLLAGHVPSWLVRDRHYELTLTTATRGAASTHHKVFHR